MVEPFNPRTRYPKCTSGVVCANGAEASWVAEMKEGSKVLVCDQCLVYLRSEHYFVSLVPIFTHMAGEK